MSNQCRCGGSIRCSNCGSSGSTECKIDVLQKLFPVTSDFLEAKEALGGIDSKISDALLFLMIEKEQSFLKFIRDIKNNKKD